MGSTAAHQIGDAQNQAADAAARQHILAYRPYTDKIVWKFVERAITNGMNVFRIFEATNDFRNIETATRAVKELGGEAHVEVNYTVSPVHTLEKWMEYAEQLIDVGADWL